MISTEKIILKLVTKAILQYKLIEDGDRILLGISGGKDSSTLAYALSKVKQAVKCNYELTGVHIANDFTSGPHIENLHSMIEHWNIPLYDLTIPIKSRLKPGRSMNCYWCSTQRRTELLNYAIQNGYNKIALGHHLDDIIETFFMNMMYKSELSTMEPKLSYNKYPVTLIRPLALIEERQIIEFATEAGFISSTCTCDFGINSSRRKVREKIALLTNNSSSVKRNIYASMFNNRFENSLHDAFNNEIL